MNTNTTKKLLFTPGPLTTSKTVKENMLRDLGSRDYKFIQVVSEVRNYLLELGEVSKDLGYEAVIMQGSGTFGIESVISSALPKNGHLLLIINGAYGDRMAKMAGIHQIKTSKIIYKENQVPLAEDVENALKKDDSITHVAIVHCETTTGILNPLEEIAGVIKKYNKAFIVDAMSSFGAVPLNIKQTQIDYLISSSNKCIEGVPGFSFIICSKSELLKCENNARTLSLDLFEQWKALENNGQFRFTPPVQVILAFHKALLELKAEGGVEKRGNRYKKNNETLLRGMQEMGFKLYLEQSNAGYIITSFEYPEHPAFDFNDFYKSLNEKGFVIYPGKLSHADCFRIGNIGQIYPEDIMALLTEIQEISKELQVVN